MGASQHAPIHIIIEPFITIVKIADIVTSAQGHTVTIAKSPLHVVIIKWLILSTNITQELRLNIAAQKHNMQIF